MKKIWSAIFLAALLATVARGQQDRRFLILVETAQAMKPQLAVARNCLSNLFASEFNGQLQAGDTLGVWTYSSELHAGGLPMQIWGADGTEKIPRHVDDFLKKQICQGDAHLAIALPAVWQVVTNSDEINVLIFSDGFEPIQGTSFDSAINRIYEQHRDDLQKWKMPFVTVLQARGGKILHCTVNSAGGTVNIAALPPPPKPAVAAPAPEPPPAPMKTNPPLIVDYSKSNIAPATVTATSNSPEVPLATTQVATIEVASPKSNASVPPSTATSVALKTSAPVETTTGVPVYVVVGIAALLVGIVFGWAFFRARSAPRSSMITESLERRKK